MTIKISKKITGYAVQTPEDKARAEAAEAARAAAAAPAEAEVPSAEVIHMHERVERPERLDGSTYKIKSPLFEHALYVTINDIVLNEGTAHESRRPFEVFINSKNMDHFQWAVALTRIMSAVFRKGGDVTFIVEELKAVFDPRGGQWMGGRYVPSLLAAIGGVIERHLVEIGFLAPTESPRLIDAIEERMRLAANGGNGSPEAVAGSGSATSMGQCPQCGGAALTHQEGCDVCLNCGYSRCG